MRIGSFLPSATEILCELGLEKDLVGITHECDYPPSVRSLPVIVRSVMNTETMSPEEIDRMVSERMRAGQSLYEIDPAVLKKANPELIFTQDLCQVCAPSQPQALDALSVLAQRPEIVYLTPHSLKDIWSNIAEIGRHTQRESEAKALMNRLSERVERVAQKTRSLKPKKVLFLEWAEPLFNGGHWIPEMIELAGGEDLLAQRDADSVRLSWEKILAYQPDVIFLSPCGYNASQAMQQLPLLSVRPGWKNLPAVRKSQVYALDASAYFARPGPRVVDGIELLAHLLLPEEFEWHGPAQAFERIDEPYLTDARRM